MGFLTRGCGQSGNDSARGFPKLAEACLLNKVVSEPLRQFLEQAWEDEKWLGRCPRQVSRLIRRAAEPFVERRFGCRFEGFSQQLPFELIQLIEDTVVPHCNCPGRSKRPPLDVRRRSFQTRAKEQAHGWCLVHSECQSATHFHGARIFELALREREDGLVAYPASARPGFSRGDFPEARILLFTRGARPPRARSLERNYLQRAKDLPRLV